jgi:hypothetical protein
MSEEGIQVLKRGRPDSMVAVLDRMLDAAIRSTEEEKCRNKWRLQSPRQTAESSQSHELRNISKVHGGTHPKLGPIRTLAGNQ